MWGGFRPFSHRLTDLQRINCGINNCQIQRGSKSRASESGRGGEREREGSRRVPIRVLPKPTIQGMHVFLSAVFPWK